MFRTLCALLAILGPSHTAPAPKPVIEAEKAVARLQLVYDDGRYAYGSGVLIRPDTILTARHCAENTIFILVTFPNHTTTRLVPAKDEWLDTDADLATLHIAPIFTIKPIKLASEHPTWGIEVYSIGYPGRSGNEIVEYGTLYMRQTLSGPYYLNGHETFDVHTAHTPPGNSGGALLDKSGYLIGTIVRWNPDNADWNAAVPIDIIQHDLK